MGFAKVSWELVEALFPMYFPSCIAFASAKFFKSFNIEGHATIAKLLFCFFLPFYTFNFASEVDPFHLDLRFFAADVISKLLILFPLALWANFHPNGSFHWCITCFSLCFLTNALVVGVPLAKTMYGPIGVDLVVQAAVTQAVFWLPMLLIALELRQKRFQSSDIAEALSSVDNVQKIGEDEENNLKAEIIELEKTCSNNNNMPDPFMVKKVFLKLITNPNIHACVYGLVWALVAKRYKFEMPTIVKGAVEFMSQPATCTAMFDMGVFMGVENNLKACGVKKAILGFVLKFIIGPAAMTIASLAVGLKGDVLKVAIIQATIPQSITSFIYANEYKLHQEVVGTSVILGAITYLPVLLVCEVVLRSFS